VYNFEDYKFKDLHWILCTRGTRMKTLLVGQFCLGMTPFLDDRAPLLRLESRCSRQISSNLHPTLRKCWRRSPNDPNCRDILRRCLFHSLHKFRILGLYREPKIQLYVIILDKKVSANQDYIVFPVTI
jgi:hypothetical protein